MRVHWTELHNVFEDDEADLIRQALHQLLKVKKEAEATINVELEKLGIPTRIYPSDFAIPRIEKLIEHFDF